MNPAQPARAADLPHRRAAHDVPAVLPERDRGLYIGLRHTESACDLSDGRVRTRAQFGPYVTDHESAASAATPRRRMIAKAATVAPIRATAIATGTGDGPEAIW